MSGPRPPLHEDSDSAISAQQPPLFQKLCFCRHPLSTLLAERIPPCWSAWIRLANGFLLTTLVYKHVGAVLVASLRHLVRFCLRRVNRRHLTRTPINRTYLGALLIPHAEISPNVPKYLKYLGVSLGGMFDRPPRQMDGSRLPSRPARRSAWRFPSGRYVGRFEVPPFLNSGLDRQGRQEPQAAQLAAVGLNKVCRDECLKQRQASSWRPSRQHVCILLDRFISSPQFIVRLSPLPTICSSPPTMSREQGPPDDDPFDPPPLTLDRVMEGWPYAAQESPFLKLHVEILHTISRHLADDTKTLAAMALVNSDFRQLARSCQFRSCVIRTPDALVRHLRREATERKRPPPSGRPPRPSLGCCIRHIIIQRPLSLPRGPDLEALFRYALSALPNATRVTIGKGIILHSSFILFLGGLSVQHLRVQAFLATPLTGPRLPDELLRFKTLDVDYAVRTRGTFYFTAAEHVGHIDNHSASWAPILDICRPTPTLKWRYRFEATLQQGGHSPQFALSIPHVQARDLLAARSSPHSYPFPDAQTMTEVVESTPIRTLNI